MKLTGIIKDSFLFPSKNTGRFGIYLLLSVLMIGFALGGILTYILGLFNGEYYLLGGMYAIIALMMGILLTGYHISIIKSGIKLDDNVPVFKLYENFMTGFDNFVIAIIYYLIPALIVLLVAFDTKLFEYITNFAQELFLQAYNVYIMGNSVNLAVNALTPIVSNIMNSLSITINAALIIFLIFAILQSISEARLANTGSIKEALNIYESAKDIKRIGTGKTVLTFIIMLAIIILIEIIIITVLSSYTFLMAIALIIMNPYLGLVSRRALGLLYSDIA